MSVPMGGHARRTGRGPDAGGATTDGRGAGPLDLFTGHPRRSAPSPGRADEAALAYGEALQLASTDPERRYPIRRLSETTRS